MTTHHYAKFDRHMSRFDWDSQRWADGGGQHDAVEYLQNFQDEDWSKLLEDYATKERLWRGCLASALNPYLGETAQNILIALITDPDREVAFEAVYSAAFYCGVNANAEGHFIDPKIVHPAFLERVRSTDAITEKIRSASSGCNEYFSEKFRLLETIVSRNAL